MASCHRAASSRSHTYAFFPRRMQPVAINSRRHRKCRGQHHFQAMHSTRRMKTAQFIPDCHRTFGCEQRKLEGKKDCSRFSSCCKTGWHFIRQLVLKARSLIGCVTADHLRSETIHPTTIWRHHNEHPRSSRSTHYFHWTTTWHCICIKVKRLRWDEEGGEIMECLQQESSDVKWTHNTTVNITAALSGSNAWLWCVRPANQQNGEKTKYCRESKGSAFDFNCDVVQSKPWRSVFETQLFSHTDATLTPASAAMCRKQRQTLDLPPLV